MLDESGRHYFRNCFIEGAVDVISGNGKSIYQVNQIEIMNSDLIVFFCFRNHEEYNFWFC